MAILSGVRAISLPHISLPGTTRTPTSSNNPSRATSPIRSKQPSSTSTTSTGGSNSPPLSSTSTAASPTKSRKSEDGLSSLSGDKVLNGGAGGGGGEKERRPSVSAITSLGAALGLRRSASGVSPATTPSTTPTTPATATTTKGSTRPVSDSSVGLVPLSAVVATTVSERSSSSSRHRSHSQSRHPKESSSSRSNSSNRAQSASRVHPHSHSHLSPLSTNQGTLLPIGQSHSQPPLLRRTTGQGGGGGGSLGISGVGVGAGVGSTPSSGRGTPIGGGGGGGGVGTPSGSSGAALNLEESYAGKVALKLSEAVNKVFLSGEKGAVVGLNLGNGGNVVQRAVPSAIRAREVGEIISRELHSALSDHYLLRNILRSSILKTLSVFLTRLSALLLSPPPTPYLPNPLLSSIPPTLSYNLQIVRCAYELKTALKHLRIDGQMPPGIGETLRPWEAKLEELMARVMGPLILGVKMEVGRICEKSRKWDMALLPSVGSYPVGGLGGVGGGGGGGGATTVKVGGLPGSTQLRSLTGSTGGGPISPAGPFWIKELASLLEGIARLILKLDCYEDKDRWLCTVGTSAIWKGMLGMSARRMDDMPAAASVVAHSSLTAAGAAAAAKEIFSKAKIGSTKATLDSLATSSSSHPPSTPSTPTPGSTTNLAHGTTIVAHTPEDLAFVRFLAELELFESRILSFISLISSPSTFLDTSNILLSGTCPSTISCGLCKTGRSFDAESSDSDEEADEAATGRLSLYALREATQALSALIVVVRAYRVNGGRQLMDALEGMKPEDEEEVGSKVAEGEEDDEGASSITIKPLTPMALLSLAPPPVPTPTAVPATPTVPATCPTLSYALDTLPSLLLFHTLASRLPSSPHFRLPHEIWGLEWSAYEKELRSFASGEEWAVECGWEMGEEVERVKKEGKGKEEGRELLMMLERAIRVKVGSPADGI